MHTHGEIKGGGVMWETRDRKSGELVKDVEEGVEIRWC